MVDVIKSNHIQSIYSLIIILMCAGGCHFQWQNSQPNQPAKGLLFGGAGCRLDADESKKAMAPFILGYVGLALQMDYTISSGQL